MNQSTTVDDESVLSRRWVRYGLIWGIWTIVALFFSTQVFLMYYAEKQPIRYTRTSSHKRPPSTPGHSQPSLVLWLSRRFRIERSKWLRRVGLHSLFSLILCFRSLPSISLFTCGSSGAVATSPHSGCSTTFITTSIVGS